VLAGDGSLVCRRKAIPTVDSLGEVERAAPPSSSTATTPQSHSRTWPPKPKPRSGCCGPPPYVLCDTDANRNLDSQASIGNQTNSGSSVERTAKLHPMANAAVEGSSQ